MLKLGIQFRDELLFSQPEASQINEKPEPRDPGLGNDMMEDLIISKSIVESIPNSNRVQVPKSVLTEEDSSDMLCAENEKPGSANPGFFADLPTNVDQTAKKRNHIPSILADPRRESSSNNYLTAELAMTYDTGYIRIPRSLLNDPRFRQAPLAYRMLYLEILNRAAILPHEFNDRGKIIQLEVGEICMSIDMLADACGRGISHKQVERGIKYFLKFQFLGTKGGTKGGIRRSVIKVTHPETYELILQYSETRSGTNSGTKAGQMRDIRREDRERREKYKTPKGVANGPKRTRSATASEISFSFDSRTWERISPEDHEGWKKAYPGVDLTSELARMAEWLLANPDKRKKNYRAFIQRWLTKSQEASGLRSLGGFAPPRRSGREIASDKTYEPFRHKSLGE